MTSMPPRRIGGMKVSAVGLGAMLLSLAGRPDEAGALRTIHAALDAGITLIDTADAYCLDGSEVGHNERLVAKALAAWSGDRDRVLVATKGGHTRPSRPHSRPGRVWPPLVATSTRSRSPGQAARALATSRSLWPTSPSPRQ